MKFVFSRSTSISKRSIVSRRCMARDPIHLSSQGISGKVCFQGRELLVISPHMEYAYVTFNELQQRAHDRLIAYLPAFPGITAIKQATSHLPISELRSTGDNLRFREELIALAHRMLDEV